MGVSLGLALGIGFTWGVILVLLLGGIWNLTLTVFTLLEIKLQPYKLIALIGDMLLAYLLFFLTWPIESGLAWIGLLPLITAALFFQWIGSALLVVLNLLTQGALAWVGTTFQSGDPADVLNLLLALAPVYLVVGVLATLGGQRANRKKRQEGSPNDTAERRRTIYELISTLSASLNYQRTLDTALSLSTSSLSELDAHVDNLVGIIMFYAQEDKKSTALQVVASRMLLPADKNLTLPGTRGLIGYAIEEGRPSKSRSIGEDPELKLFVSLRGYKSAYCIPLRSGLDAYGVMLFADPDRDFFIPDRCEVLDIIGKQFVIAIQNARLYQDLEQEKERMMEIQDDSRKKLARELHDGPTQSVAAIAMRVNFARRMMERDQNTAAEELFKIEELARRTTKEIRLMLFTLRPLVLESQGLLAALESMADKINDTYDQKVVVQADPNVFDHMEPAKQTIVFYIAEEATNNARKHAQANQIWVRVRMIRKGLSLLEIEDDGVGFDIRKVDSAYEDRGSLGMVNMRERAELVNGVIHIDSSAGRGTRVQVAIPLTDDAAEILRRGS